MKRNALALALALLLVCALLTGCGSSGSAGAAAASADTRLFAEDNGTFDSLEGKSMLQSTAGAAAEPAASSGTAQTTDNPAKLIFTAELTLETTEFDTSAAAITDLADRLGGYLESSSVSNGGDGYRYASYTVRVPAKQFASFCTQVSKLCHVTYQASSAEDVSQNYYDTQGRLKTQQTKLERLQTLLAKAEKMEDIITIESAISDTEEQIDSLSGELQHYDAQVNYSTVNLTLNEVYRLSNTEEPATGFGSRLGTALSSGIDTFVRALQGFAVFLAYSWIWLVLLAAAIAVPVCLTRRQRKKREAARAAARQEQQKPPAPPET